MSLGRYLGGTARYLLAALATIPRYRPQRLSVQVDEERWEVKAWLVAVGNSRSYGGGMLITPDADLYDGRFDVCIVEASAPCRAAASAPRGCSGGAHVRVDGVQVLRGTRVELHALDTPGTPESPALGAPVLPELWGQR